MKFRCERRVAFLSVFILSGTIVDSSDCVESTANGLFGSGSGSGAGAWSESGSCAFGARSIVVVVFVIGVWYVLFLRGG